jgi:hypothetical protein
VPEPRHGAAAERVAGAHQAVGGPEGGSAPQGGVQAADAAGGGMADVPASGVHEPTESRGGADMLPRDHELPDRDQKASRSRGGESDFEATGEPRWDAQGCVHPGVRARLLLSAVRAGTLPNLIHFDFSLKEAIHREILSGGILPLLEDVRLKIHLEDAEQVAALEHLRRLKHLRRLSVECIAAEEETAFPPFIPHSLESLSLDFNDAYSLEFLLQELPSMLRASGAGLEEITFRMCSHFSAEGSAALIQVLRTCSSTLKTLELEDPGMHQPSSTCIPGWLPCLMSCCATLEVLHCPWSLFSALPATCPAFPRLVELYVRVAGPSLEGDCTSPAWDMMANGRLPALATFSVRGSDGLVWGEGAGRLARVLEAVADTLRRLTLIGGWKGSDEDPPAGACYEVGATIGKLRHLRYLDIDLFRDGRDYQAMGRGMAASGGCPELFKVKVIGVTRNGNWLALEPGLIVPSVRDLSVVGHQTEEQALLLCCGLVQAGYDHPLRLELHGGARLPSSALACMRTMMRAVGMSVHLR